MKMFVLLADAYDGDAGSSVSVVAVFTDADVAEAARQRLTLNAGPSSYATRYAVEVFTADTFAPPAARQLPHTLTR